MNSEEKQALIKFAQVWIEGNESCRELGRIAFPEQSYKYYQIMKIALAALEAETVAWQFYYDGGWHNGSNHNNHRENKEKYGYLTRELICITDTYTITSP